MQRSYSAESSEFLRRFLATPEREGLCFSYFELEGFLVSVLSSPTLVRPSTWMAEVWDMDDAQLFRNAQEAELASVVLLSKYNDINVRVRDQSYQLPPECLSIGDGSADTPFAQWCRGFLRGNDLCATAWDLALDLYWDLLDQSVEHLSDAELEQQLQDEPFPDLGDDLDAVLDVVNAGANLKMARKQAEADGNQVFLDNSEMLPQVINQVIANFARIGQTLEPLLQEAYGDADLLQDPSDSEEDFFGYEESFQAPSAHTHPKVGRNDPCPCGSGKKYKKCCLILN